MVGLVDDAFLLLFPGSIRSPQCAQRVTATRSGLLVCLPYHTEPHQEALSRTKRDGDPCAFRESGTGAQQLALACHNHNDTLGKLPPMATGQHLLWAKVPPFNQPGGNVFYWLLPFVEQDNVYRLPDHRAQTYRDATLSIGT